MDLMEARRRLLMQKSNMLDTSPKIAEYGACWNRTFGSKTSNANWCITDWYDIIDAPFGDINVQGYIGSDSTSITFQYHFSNGTNDWYYFNSVNPRKLPGGQRTVSDISFSIQIAEVNNSYAYVVETGQIIFAGKNTIYYGYKNINDMPYRPVEYLESTGTQYIDMLLEPQYYWEFKTNFELLQIADDNCIFGSQSGNGYAISVYRNKWQVKYGPAAQYPDRGNPTLENHTIETKIINIDQQYPSAEFYDNGTLFYTKQGNGYFTVPASLTIFALRNSNNIIFYSLIRMKQFEIRNAFNQSQIAHLIPCVRKSDSKPGMYDIVSKTFYTNAGTGEFIVPA